MANEEDRQRNTWCMRYQYPRAGYIEMADGRKEWNVSTGGAHGMATHNDGKNACIYAKVEIKFTCRALYMLAGYMDPPRILGGKKEKKEIRVRWFYFRVDTWM